MNIEEKMGTLMQNLLSEHLTCILDTEEDEIKLNVN